MLHLSDFDYYLPKNLIAQKPIRPRDNSRLLVVSKNGSTNIANTNIEHKYFYNIVDYLKKGDVLVLNNSKVFPARLIGRKKETGGKIEVFLISMTPILLKGKRTGNNIWQCLLGGRGLKNGLEIEFYLKNKNFFCLECRVIKKNSDGTWNIEFNKENQELKEIINKIGFTPLPPYIKRSQDYSLMDQNDKDDYQTVYADNKKIGSVAAPTAGFHFTPSLIKKLKAKGVQFEYITLHVGIGTFAPVKVDDIRKHKMHAEWAEADKKTIANIYLAKRQKRRIIAAGTTSVRVLEEIASKFPITKSIKHFASFKSMVDIFIYPGYKFKMVDAMITNFHLPKSTLLMLVSAFAGKKIIDKAYKEAIKNKYRFYSYGDAMFII